MNENILVGGISDEDVFSVGAESVSVDTLDGAYSPIGGGNTVSGGDSYVSLQGGLDSAEPIPVMIVAQADTAIAVGTDNGYQLPTYYVDYFKGVLDTLGNTDYVAFCTRDYYGTYNYVEHYRLVYNIDVEDGNAVIGTYPCLDIYRDSGASNYTVSNTAYTLNTIPSFSYGNFGVYSDLRGGISHVESYSLLFFLGFFAVYTVCHDIFSYIMGKVFRR